MVVAEQGGAVGCECSVTRFRAVMLFAAVGCGMRSAIEVSARVLSALPLFLAAVFISFALDPVVAALHRRGLERHRATQLVFIGTTVLAAGFVYGIFSVLAAAPGKLVSRSSVPPIR